MFFNKLRIRLLRTLKMSLTEKLLNYLTRYGNYALEYEKLGLSLFQEKIWWRTDPLLSGDTVNSGRC
jgi:hypothetical protein